GATNVLGGVANQRAAGVTVGTANFPVSTFGVVRQVSYEVAHAQSFAVATALVSGVSRSRLRSDFQDNEQWIDFPGGAGTVKQYSFLDVLRGQVPAARLRGKIV